MLITFVIPAFNASGVVSRALGSVFDAPLPVGWRVEVVVVDDGSSDAATLEEVVKPWAGARILAHGSNRGMCAARNTGISASIGSIVTILDADDELVPGWPAVFESILQAWPKYIQVCYAACRNPEGRSTVLEPEYSGFLTLSDILNERHSGEYLPLFRGEYVRSKLYADLGMRKSCGIVSYIGYAMDGPFWVSNQVLRIYHDNNAHSVTSGWAQAGKSSETAECYNALLERYGELYRAEAPVVYRTKLLRLAVYLRLANQTGYWRCWLRGASFSAIKESVGAAIVLLIGPAAGAMLVSQLKKIGMIRRYG